MTRFISPQFYRNDGSGVFNNINAGLTGVSGSSAAWGDYDNDGDLDILLAGYTDSGSVAAVYGMMGVASSLTSMRPGGRWFRFSSWGTMITMETRISCLTGQGVTRAISPQFYQNRGNGVFTDIHAALAGVISSSVAWATMTTMETLISC